MIGQLLIARARRAISRTGLLRSPATLIGRILAATTVVARLLAALSSSFFTTTTVLALPLSLRIRLVLTLAGRRRFSRWLLLTVVRVALLGSVDVLLHRGRRARFFLGVLPSAGLPVFAETTLFGLAAGRVRLARFGLCLRWSLRFAARARFAVLLSARALIFVIRILSSAVRRCLALLIRRLRVHGPGIGPRIACVVRCAAWLRIIERFRTTLRLFRTITLSLVGAGAGLRFGVSSGLGIPLVALLPLGRLIRRTARLLGPDVLQSPLDYLAVMKRFLTSILGTGRTVV